MLPSLWIIRCSSSYCAGRARDVRVGIRLDARGVVRVVPQDPIVEMVPDLAVLVAQQLLELGVDVHLAGVQVELPDPHPAGGGGEAVPELPFAERVLRRVECGGLPATFLVFARHVPRIGSNRGAGGEDRAESRAAGERGNHGGRPLSHGAAPAHGTKVPSHVSPIRETLGGPLHAPTMTLSRRILVGIGAGVALGLLVGERAAPLELAADAYVRLLQMTVLPYVVVSLVSGLGSLTTAQAKKLLQRVGVMLALLWGLGITFAFLIPLTFPHWETASFYSSSDTAAREEFDFLGALHSHQPLRVAGQQRGAGGGAVQRRDRGRAHRGAGQGAAHSAPARPGPGHRQGQPRHDRAGSLSACSSPRPASRAPCDLEELRRVEVYLVAYGAAALLLMAWVLPGLVGVLTPARYGEVVPPARDALITAALTGSLFAVLPDAGGDRARRPEAPRPRPPGGGGSARRGRPRVLQLPARGQAAVPELHPVRGLVLRVAAAGAATTCGWPARGCSASSGA